MDGTSQDNPAPDPRAITRPHQAPLAVIGVAFAAGILLDAAMSVELVAWLFASAGLAIFWCVLACSRRFNASAVCLLLAWVAAGAGSHHLVWSTVSDNEVSLRATTEPTPIDLVAVVDERPSVRGAAPSPMSVLPPTDRTLCRVRVRSIREAGHDVSSSGLVQLIVSGHLLAERGDVIRLRGAIQLPQAPGNPGEFDYRAFLRRRQVHSIVRVHDPGAIETVERTTAASLVWYPNRARRIAGDILRQSLDSDVYPVAAAVLLGERDEITRDLREAFAESGTMHLLAISGLHVGILALFLWQLSRLLHLRLHTEIALIVTCLVGYTLITDIRPSILRASVLLGSLMIGRLWYRPVNGPNMLGGAVLFLLVRNPADLFDVGAQLSFLAVVAITWGLSFRTWSSLETDAVAPVPRRAGKWLVFCLERDIRMMLVVAAITGPLVAYSFNLYAPVGIAINLMLISLVRWIMIGGYLVLLTGFFSSWLAVLPAFVFSKGLTFLHWTAQLGSGFQLGHRYGPAPSVIWLVAFYSMFAAAALWRGQRRRWLVVAMLGWGCVGVGCSLLQADGDELRCTVLDVGHGSAVLVEAPNGQTLLVDVGSIDSPVRAQRAVQDCLWYRGRSRIDLLAITHADLDHFSGAELLMQETVVSAVTCPQSFLLSSDPAADHLRSVVGRRQIPIHAVQRGQHFLMGDVVVDVLHPGESATNQFADDNASSLVLLVQYAGRRILLTGDISGKGRTRLLASSIDKIDMLLAPHHGGRYDNRSEFKDWARPDFVVASSRRIEALNVLESVYPDAKSFVTKRDGAVTCVVRSDGSLSVTAHRQSPSD